MSKTPSVAILIPLYKSSFSPSEEISFHQYQKYLSAYDTFALIPNGSSFSLPSPTIRSISFSPSYFSSVQSYSKLLLTESFYKTFASYEHILIYQLDALVLRDELKYWCSQPWSYIGAPWKRPLVGFLTSKEHPVVGGNGGFSLRKVQDCLKVLRTAAKESRTAVEERNGKLNFFLALAHGNTRKKWLNLPAFMYPFNEDGFWSFEARKYSSSFFAAPLSEQTRFAFETHPRKYFEENDKRLPFGCHAWEKYDKTFWESII